MKEHLCPNTLERIECPVCKNEIDPNVCHCGDAKEYHDPTHSFTPIGCTCGYDMEQRLEPEF